MSRLVYFVVPGIILAMGLYIFQLRVQNQAGQDLRSLGENLRTFSLEPPPNLTFAGELVPLDDPDVRERFDQELVRNVFFHAATILSMKRLGRWREPIGAILKEKGIPEDFIYLCIAESQLTNARSWRGAQGFWQFMEVTGKQYGLEINNQVDERFDPIKSTVAACRYLNDAHKKFRNWTLVAASYNMGINGIEIAVNSQKVTSYYDLHLNAETAAYIYRILAIKAVMENPKMYGFELDKHQLYPPLKYKTLRVKENIPDLIQFSLENKTTLKMLKAYNPWLLTSSLKVKSGQSYIIKIPTDSIDVTGRIEREMEPGIGPAGQEAESTDSLME